MKKQLPYSLFEKYLNGDCTEREEAVVKEWYNSFVNDDDYVSAISTMQRDNLKARIKNAIDENTILLEHTSAQEPRPPKSIIKYLVYSIGGIAAMLLLAYGLTLTSKRAVVQQPVNQIAMLSVVNHTKAIYEQILSDGSHVWLYPGAKITFAKKFSGNTREISMAGESFFDITKNKAKPFIIHSEHIITKVWGTTFRVRDSKADAFADVTVVTGKVSVKPVGPVVNHVSEVMLHPNEQATYYKHRDVLQTNRHIADVNLNIWKKVNLSFDNKPIGEVIPVLNKNYNVNIISTDAKLNAYRLDADLNGLNFAAVMEILRKTLNISYEINTTSILLKNNN